MNETVLITMYNLQTLQKRLLFSDSCSFLVFLEAPAANYPQLTERPLAPINGTCSKWKYRGRLCKQLTCQFAPAVLHYMALNNIEMEDGQ